MLGLGMLTLQRLLPARRPEWASAAQQRWQLQLGLYANGLRTQLQLLSPGPGHGTAPEAALEGMLPHPWPAHPMRLALPSLSENCCDHHNRNEQNANSKILCCIG